MKGRTPTADEKKHMDRVRELGCIICRTVSQEHTPAEIHHIDGKTKPGSHYHVLPLCYFHHRGAQDGHKVVSRHPNKAEFEQKYGTEKELHLKVMEALKEYGY